MCRILPPSKGFTRSGAAACDWTVEKLCLSSYPLRYFTLLSRTYFQLLKKANNKLVGMTFCILFN